MKQSVDCCIAHNKEMNKVVIVNGNAIFNIETIFARLLVVSRQRCVEVTEIFQYERSRVPPSLIDEFGCFEKRRSTLLIKCLGIPVNSAPASDVALIDTSQLYSCIMFSGLSLGQQALLPRASV